MSLLDTVAKALILVKADTSDAERAIKGLTGVEKEAAKARLQTIKDSNAGYDSWIKKLGDANQAIELAGRAVNFAKESFKAYSEDLRLRSAAGAVSIDKLKEASLGLRTEHELLAFAAKTQHGVYKLTEEQMATAQRAMVALTREGHEQAKVVDKVTEALVKGKAEGFDDFGISVKKGTTDAENFKNMMDALAKKASGVKDGTHTAAEGVEAMGVSMQESIDKMKQAIGQLVASMEPLLRALASAVGIIADLARGHAEVGAKGGTQAYMEDLVMTQKGWVKDSRGRWVRPEEIERGKAAADRAKTEQYWGGGNTRGLDAAKFGSTLSTAAADLYWSGATSDTGKIDEAAYATFMRRHGLMGDQGRPGETSGYLGDLSSSIRFGSYGAIAGVDPMTQGIADMFKKVMADSLASNPGVIGRHGDTRSNLSEVSRVVAEMQEEVRAQLEAQTKGRQKSILTTLFGEHSEVDLWVSSFERLGSVFTGFGEAVGASYETIVTGQGSASAAFKKVVADSLMATGKQSAIKAIQELALAAGSAAFGNFGDAALHLKSAGLHSAVAVAAGVAANQLGTSAQVAASDKAAADKAKEDEKAKKEADKGGKGGGGAGRGGDSERPIYILMGESFGDDSQRVRRQRAEAAVERALRERDE